MHGATTLHGTRIEREATSGTPARVRVPEGVLFREVSGEAVVLELASGHYYGLDTIGTRIWNLLSEDGRIDNVHRRLLAEYDVESDGLLSDLKSFVGELLDRGLLTAELS